MPSQALPPLHLYRHLLREATYLPKPCLPYIRQQITTRFKKHMKDDPKDPLTARRRHVAHSNLRTLRAANAGVLNDMKHIIYLATGRTGRRRRKLIAQTFLVVQNNDSSTKTPSDPPPGIPASPQRPSLHQGKPLEPDWLDNWDLSKIAALAASQSRQTLVMKRPEIKGTQLAPTVDDIPAENSLGRPYGAKAARGKLRRWYKNLINKLMAPLPREEWEALGRLARGEDDAWAGGPPARRKMCGGSEANKKGRDWTAYAVEPVRSVERPQSRSMKARTGEEGVGPYGLGRAIGLRRYDRARTWARMYMRVWEATPTMEAVEGSGGGRGGKWKIEWGSKRAREVPTAMAAQRDFLMGAPEGAVKVKRVLKTLKFAEKETA